MNRFALWTAAWAILLGLPGCDPGEPPPPAPQSQPAVRVAVIGGMTMTGVWQELAALFEQQTGWHVEMVTTGPRPGLARAMQAGEVDLLTMHSGDVTTNLVADGYAVNMRPWTKNDLVIVGPADDPAGIRGLDDGAEALRRIAAAKANFIDFHGVGSREVCHNLWAEAGVQPAGDWVIKDESRGHLDILGFAARSRAYVIVGRMPVLFDKLRAAGMDILVAGDSAMQRPYIVMEANPDRFAGVNAVGARALSDFLLSDAVQTWLAESPTNRRGGIPLFHPIARPGE